MITPINARQTRNSLPVFDAKLAAYRVQAPLHPNSGVSVAPFSMVIIRRAEGLVARTEPALSPDNLDSHCQLR